MLLNESKSRSTCRVSILKIFLPWIFRVSVIVILVLLFYENINLSLLLQHFDSSLLTNMLMIQPIIVAAIFLISLRFSCLMPAPKPPFFQVFKSLTLTMGLNNMLPGRIAELVKPTYLKENGGIPIRTSLAAVLLERIIDVLILCILATACITTQLFNINLLWVMIFLILLVCLTLLYFYERSISQFVIQHTKPKFRSVIEYLINYLSTALRYRYFYVAVVYSIGGWLLSFLAVATFLQMSIDAQIGGLGAFTVFVATVIGIAIPAMPGGFGTYEAAAVMVLKEFGIGYEQALAIAIALHLSQICFYVLGAVMILTFERVGVVRFARQLYSSARMAGRYE